MTKKIYFFVVEKYMAYLCKGITKKGKPCKNKTYAEFCHHHRTNKTEKTDTKDIEDIKDVEEEQKEVSKECAICYEETTEHITFTCNHFMCKTCVKQLQKHVCPFCRRDISSDIPNDCKMAPIAADRISFEELRELLGVREATLLMLIHLQEMI